MNWFGSRGGDRGKVLFEKLLRKKLVGILLV